jgi:uncharacterized phiE125 gp8 family phage protein
MIKVITPPTEEPITLAEAKANLRVVFSDEDADIERMIRAARQMAEERLNRALMPQTLAFGADAFCVFLKVPRPPLAEIDSIKYIDADGVEQTVPAGYLVDEFVDPPTITPAYGTPWPTTRAQAGAVVVQYQAGYADAASVPEPIRQWMLLSIGVMYENRTAVVNGTISQAIAGDFYDMLLQPFKVYQ